ncbi:hypothetical protein [Nocardia abscessus]|uniref:hypothetical protein n=1 Tax=Nocardia abscessus TaxID=120957 RepID=UPI002454FE9C|nr:hypothetical protein [Nocardia abscessus]
MTNPLSPLEYGKVVGRLLAGIIDSPDVGVIPDFPPLEGRVTFTASVPKFLVPTADPPATVAPLAHPYFTAVLDDEGYLTWRGERGVYLAAPVAGTMNPSGWTWTVSFDLSYLGTPVPISPFSFNVPEYTPGPDPEDPDEGSVGLVDLTLVSPVPSSTGNAVTQGNSVVSVSIDGNELTFGLSNGSFLPPVEVPAIQDALNAATAAAASATAADGSADAAAAAVNSFDLNIGTVTTLPPGSSATASVGGGPPVWELDLGIPEGDVGATGPAAPDATSGTKGILQLTGDLGGTAASPTVPGLASKVDATRTISTTAPLTGGGDLSANRTLAVSDATTGAKGVVQLAGILAGTAAAPAFSAAAFGTTSTTAAVGDDARLSDTRTPSANTVPSDFVFVATSPSTTRATGSGDWTVGMYVGRAFTLTKAVYQFETADASGNTTVEVRRNGSQVTNSNLTISAANQADGSGTDTARTASTISQSFAVGDRIGVQITAVGTTPGKGLKVYLFGTWN